MVTSLTVTHPKTILSIQYSSPLKWMYKKQNQKLSVRGFDPFGLMIKWTSLGGKCVHLKFLMMIMKKVWSLTNIWWLIFKFKWKLKYKTLQSREEGEPVATILKSFLALHGVAKHCPTFDPHTTPEQLVTRSTSDSVGRRGRWYGENSLCGKLSGP